MRVLADASGEGYMVHISMAALESQGMERESIRYAVEKIATEIAQRFLQEHGQTILKSLDPQAVANIAIAQAGAAINETLGKKLPDKILERIITNETHVKHVWTW